MLSCDIIKTAQTAKGDGVSNLIEEVRAYVRQRVESDKEETRRLAREFYDATDGTFINIKRVWILQQVGTVIARQPNEYLKQCMKLTFKEEVRKCAEIAEKESTSRTTVQV